MNLDRMLLGWAKLAWRQMAGAVAAGYAGGLLAIGQAWLLSAVVDMVFLQGAGLGEALPDMWLLLAVFIARAGLGWLADGLAGLGAIRVKQVVRQLLIERLYQAGPGRMADTRSGDLAATALQGVEALDGFYSQYLPQLALAGLVPLSIVLAVLPVDGLSGLVFLITGPLIPLFMILIGRAAEAATRQQFSALGRMSAFFLETLQGLTTLKLLGQSRQRVEQIGAVSEQYRLKTMEVLRLTFLSALALELAATISTAVVAVEIGLRLLYGGLEFQAAFFILILAPEFYLPLRLLGQRFHAGAAAAAAASRIRPIVQPEAGCPAEPAVQETLAVSAPNEIKFVEVGYAYPGRSEPACQQISFGLERGKITALVGPSGAGKTTLTYLLLGFLKAQEGSIQVDGRDLAQIDAHAWREQVAWVGQRPYLFHDTLAANIRLGKPDASQEEVVWAAQMAGLDKFAASLPEGYATRVGEQGTRLSGGQGQRVALARAFLRKAPLLILDEPTARLDPELEEQLMAATRRLCAGKMGLLVAHRLGTVRTADQLVVLENGRLVEQGEPQQLLRMGRFRRLAGMQE